MQVLLASVDPKEPSSRDGVDETPPGRPRARVVLLDLVDQRPHLVQVSRGRGRDLAKGRGQVLDLVLEIMVDFVVGHLDPLQGQFEVDTVLVVHRGLLGLHEALGLGQHAALIEKRELDVGRIQTYGLTIHLKRRNNLKKKVFFRPI